VLKGKFIAISTYIKNIEKSKKAIIMLYLKLLEKQDKTKTPISRWEEILESRAGISEIGNKNGI
jgi:hypothetical protein